MSDDDRIDLLCAKTTKTQTLNALHACHEGHPLGRGNQWKWRNAYFMVRQASSSFRGSDLDWLKGKAEEEAARAWRNLADMTPVMERNGARHEIDRAQVTYVTRDGTGCFRWTGPQEVRTHDEAVAWALDRYEHYSTDWSRARVTGFRVEWF